MFPELGERVSKLARPEGGLPPEYGVKNLDNDQAGLVVRTATGGRAFVRLS
jgi:hypothetical protein